MQLWARHSGKKKECHLSLHFRHCGLREALLFWSLNWTNLPVWHALATFVFHRRFYRPMREDLLTYAAQERNSADFDVVSWPTVAGKIHSEDVMYLPLLHQRLCDQLGGFFLTCGVQVGGVLPKWQYLRISQNTKPGQLPTFKKNSPLVFGSQLPWKKNLKKHIADLTSLGDRSGSRVMSRSKEWPKFRRVESPVAKSYLRCCNERYVNYAHMNLHLSSPKVGQGKFIATLDEITIQGGLVGESS